MQPQQPYYGAPTPPPVQPNYDFIVNPQQAPKGPKLGGSMASRLLLVGVGLIVLIVVFVVIKGLFSGGGNKEAMLHVVQDQQEIVHLATAATQQQNISNANKNFATTAQLVVTSQQTQLKSYLAKQHQKLNLKEVNLKVSSTLDTNLTNAAAASTYDSTFRDIMKAQLTNYQTALKIAYNLTPGPTGRKLLTDDYTSATLLLQQLTTTN